MKKATAINWAASLLVLLWVYTAASKLLAYDLFVRQLERSPYLGFAASALSILVPVLELSIAGMLLYTNWRQAGFISSLVLLTAFSAYIILMMLTTDTLPCSCGGIIAALSWGAHLAVNSGFMLLSCIGMGLLAQQRTGNIRHI